MALITEQPSAYFDMSQIRRGDLLWGKHSTWAEGKAGIVTSAVKDQLAVQYHPGIGNVVNHFRIPVQEAAAGEWEIRWSHDLLETFGYNPPADGGQETEGGEGRGTGQETGGAQTPGGGSTQGETEGGSEA